MKVSTKILPFLVVTMLLAVPAFAQTGNIEGRVIDPDGKPVQGAVISIDRQGIAGHYEVKTDAKGGFLHAGLPTGAYVVSVTAGGRKVVCNQNVRVTFGGSAKADCDLKQAQAAAVTDEERKKAAEEKAKADATKASFEAARAAVAAKNFDEAIRLFKEAAEKDPSQHVIFANLADAQSQARRYDDSAASYRKAIELKPDEAPYHNNLGIALGNAGKIDEAIASLQKAAELNPPGAGQSYYNLGAILTNRGRTGDAAAAFKKAIEFDPKMHNAYYQLGISYFGNPQTIPEAIPTLQKFMELAAALPEAQKTPQLAGDIEAAKQLIEAAKQSAPTGFKSEKAIADEKAAAERAEKQKADAQKAKKKN